MPVAFLEQGDGMPAQAGAKGIVIPFQGGHLILRREIMMQVGVFQPRGEGGGLSHPDGGAPVDAEIRARFMGRIEQASRRELVSWQATPDGAFALVLLLDQFTRNVYRNTPDAYCGDAIAFEVVRHAIDQGLDRDLHPVARIWLYHPFHHAEEVEEQDRGLQLLKALVEQCQDRRFEKVLRKIDLYEPGTNFRAWIFEIAAARS